MQKWKTLKTDKILDHKWCKVNRDTVELPSGKVIDDYYVSIRPDVVLIFPITSDGKVIMVRQYKHGAKQVLLEFPGGILDSPDELPIAAAKRELAEETGYVSPDMERMTTVYNNPTKDTNKIYFFIARDVVKKQATAFDETEEIETVEVALDEIPKLIKEEKIVVAGSLAIYYMALTALNSEK